MPEPREIPEGKILVAEYGEVEDADKAVVAKLAEVECFGRVYKLVHSTPGWRSAGSAMTWTNGFYAVWFETGGARSGRQFKTEQEAHDMMWTWVRGRHEAAATQLLFLPNERRRL